MTKFNKYDFHFINNSSFGMIYHVPSQKIKRINIEDYRSIKNFFEKFFDNELNQKENEKFTEYLKSNFPLLNNDEKNCVDKLRLDKINKIDRLEIMLTNTCNLSCKYCYASGGTYGKKAQLISEREIEEYLSCLFTNNYNSVDTVFFFGGEPLMNMKAIEATCDFFKKLLKNKLIAKLPQYTLVTNGTLITEKIAKFLSKEEIIITVSIDGPKTINDINRYDKSGNGSYERIINGIRLLKNANAKLACFEVTYNRVHKDFGLSKKDIKKFLIDEFGDVNILIENCNGDNDVALINEEDNLQLTKAEYARIYRYLINNKVCEFSCSAGRSSLMLTEKGIFYPCHMFMLEDKYSFKTKNEYDQVYNSLESVKRSARESCKKCWARNLCCACPASLLIFSNNETSEIGCKNIKNKINKILPLIAEDMYNNSMDNYNSLI